MLATQLIGGHLEALALLLAQVSPLVAEHPADVLVGERSIAVQQLTTAALRKDHEGIRRAANLLAAQREGALGLQLWNYVWG